MRSDILRFAEPPTFKADDFIKAYIRAGQLAEELAGNDVDMCVGATVVLHPDDFAALMRECDFVTADTRGPVIFGMHITQDEKHPPSEITVKVSPL